jgi:hypothetical protein
MRARVEWGTLSLFRSCMADIVVFIDDTFRSLTNIYELFQIDQRN